MGLPGSTTGYQHVTITDHQLQGSRSPGSRGPSRISYSLREALRRRTNLIFFRQRLCKGLGCELGSDSFCLLDRASGYVFELQQRWRSATSPDLKALLEEVGAVLDELDHITNQA